jgi:hypothetical protein
MRTVMPLIPLKMIHTMELSANRALVVNGCEMSSRVFAIGRSDAAAVPAWIEGDVSVHEPVPVVSLMYRVPAASNE